MSYSIIAEGLTKRYGDTVALAGVDLEVRTGTVFGLLGPNGAGKTTAVRILATLIRPDGGHASVGGHDVVAHAHQVRQLIGLTGQYASVDESLTGQENLLLIGRLTGMSRPQARARASELLAGFRLDDAASRAVKTYSGGMRRRLDLAASLVSRPRILFLDEPTTGLDPRQPQRDVGHRGPAGRQRRHRPAHHPVPGGGRPVRRGHRGGRPRPGDRHRHAGAAQGPHRRADAGRPPGRPGPACPTPSPSWPRSPGPSPRSTAAVAAAPLTDPELMPAIVRRLDEAGVVVAELTLRRPSLDEVFLSLTGHAPANPGDPAPASRRPASRRRGAWHDRHRAHRPCPAARAGPAGQPGQGLRQSFSLAWRTLVPIKHNPGELLDFSIQPVMFVLLFTFVFGGAISGSPHSYLMFALPGIIVQNALFATLNTGMGLSTDLDKGFLDRLRTLPIARYAPLTGRILADVVKQAWAVALLMGVGAALGFRVGTTPLSVLGAFRPAADLLPRRVLDHRAGQHGRGQPGEGADLRLRGPVPADLHQRRVRQDRLDAGRAAGLGRRPTPSPCWPTRPAGCWCPARSPRRCCSRCSGQPGSRRCSRRWRCGPSAAARDPGRRPANCPDRGRPAPARSPACWTGRPRTRRRRPCRRARCGRRGRHGGSPAQTGPPRRAP